VHLIFCLTACSVENWMAFPGSIWQGAASTRLVAQDSQQLVNLSLPDGTPLAGMFGPALGSNRRPLPDVARRPTVLFFYGNGSCAAQSACVMDHFRRQQCNAMVVDYAGYGMSGGKPSESNCYSTADAALD
jgi:hypothetical protein